MVGFLTSPILIMLELFFPNSKFFLSWWRYLDTAGLKRSAAYLINGLAIFLAWLVRSSRSFSDCCTLISIIKNVFLYLWCICMHKLIEIINHGWPCCQKLNSVADWFLSQQPCYDISKIQISWLGFLASWWWHCGKNTYLAYILITQLNSLSLIYHFYYLLK